MLLCPRKNNYVNLGKMFRTRTYAGCVQSAPVAACAVVMHAGDARGACGRREG